MARQALFEDLIADADTVAGVGVRLGRIRDSNFLPALARAHEALEADKVTPTVIMDLQKALNGAIVDLAPITLGDLRSGWTPFSDTTRGRIGTTLFAIFCFLLLLATAWATQVYDRATTLYATTMELQEARGPERAIRLFGLLRKNQQEVIESLTSGTKDFLYETFNKELSDLEIMNVKFQAYGPMAAEVLYDLEVGQRLKDIVFFPARVFRGSAQPDIANPSGDPRIDQLLKGYAKAEIPTDFNNAASSAPAPLSSDQLKALDLRSLLDLYFHNLKDFTAAINVGFDPLNPNDYSYYIYRLRDGLNVLGSWVLPSLYGMLGAVVFHMRRLLEPSVPNPPWLRLAFRIVLGGFAGIVLVWFWTPSAAKAAQPAFATITSFGLAFLVGFSTDVFFQALDRLVTYLSQAIGTSSHA